MHKYIEEKHIREENIVFKFNLAEFVPHLP